jgi:CubicO group peptidase (beta-lactamase class C family)
MPRRLLVLLFLVLAGITGAQTPYFPSRQVWNHLDPAKAGFDPKMLAEAVEYAKAHESTHPRDFSNQVQTFGRLLGPIPKLRSGTKGLIVKNGYIVAEWGDIDAVEPTYSAAKSFLSTLAGVAVDHGLIKSVDDPVGNYVHDGGYDSPHNAKITWAHHLTQSSEWEGTLWEKPSTFLGEAEFGQGQMKPRSIREPGSYYEYNDVRVNRLALSLLRVFNVPLPEVLKKSIMDPIGTTSTWKYLGYDNSIIDLNGKQVQSVTGGTRWGGGLWISARDQARFGLLLSRKGNWNGQRVISEDWIRKATSPSKTKSDYGYLWWLNTGRKAWPSLSEKAFAAVGFGSNTIWIDPEKDLVVVWRWHGNGNELLSRIVAAMRPQQ